MNGDETHIYKSEQDNQRTNIGRFEVISLLGSGTFGCVYLARDPQLKREVAIKVLRSGMVHRDDVLREAQHVAGLDHKGIVTVYDVDVRTNPDEPFIVQEYVRGVSLHEQLRGGHRYSIVEAIEIILGVAEALAFAHQHRIFHRDLKPGNILIAENGQPRIIDFGLAIHEGDRQKHRGEVAGSLKFMSPEQWRGESHRLDDRSDIWSLCVVFYRLLTGRLPFGGENKRLIGDEVQFSDPIPPRQIDANIPRELERIILKGLSKRMADRYAVCQDLIDDLEPVSKAFYR